MNRTDLLRPRGGTSSARGRAVALALAMGPCALSRLGAEAVATPEFDLPGGTYPAGIEVGASCDTEGATIRYTINGQEPILIDPVIDGETALALQGTVTLKARAWKDGMEPSEVAEVTYRISGDLAGGEEFALGLTAAGELYSWGRNNDGQLGRTTGDQDEVHPVPGMTNGIMAAAGGRHGLLVRADGTVWAWGRDDYGQLGDGSSGDNRTTPAMVTNLSGVVGVAAGNYFSLAMRDDGTLWAWGQNSSGQLGAGTNTSLPVPVAVAGVSNAIGIAAGRDHALAALADGSVVAWGENGEGQLGDGSRTDRFTPVTVPGLSNVVGVGAGIYQSFAVDASGRLWAWGDGTYGALGVGDTTDRLSPTAVPGMTNVATVASTLGNFGLAIDSWGNLWGWGKNNAYQLGDGTQVDRYSPIPVGPLEGVSWTSGGGSTGYAIREDGRGWAWGGGGAGQIGDGASQTRSTPVPIPGPAWSPGPYESDPAFLQQSNGSWLVVIEAEHAGTNVARGVHSWVAETNLSGFSGEGYMTALPNQGSNRNTGFVTNSPRMDFRVRFVRTGDHHVWVRGWAPSTSDDSVHAGMDAMAVAQADRMDGFDASWKWSKETIDGNAATINVTAAGDRALSIWMREDGFSIDKILVTSDGGYTPSGAGPAESDRVGRLCPEISLLAPTNGTIFEAGSDISISADASDPFGSVVRVEFFQGTNLIAADTNAPYSVTWTNPPTATHLLSVRATDDDGMSWTAGPVVVTVLVPDADGDGLRDDEEPGWGTDPDNPDTDYDGRSDGQEAMYDGTCPTNAASYTPVRLGYWPFEAPGFVAAHGAVPTEVTNIAWAQGMIGGSAHVVAADPVLLKYRDTEADGSANINLRRGTFRIWIRPDWTSASLGGTGPGEWARIVEMGAWTQDASYGDWQLCFSPDGNEIRWGSDDGLGHLAGGAYTGVTWRAGHWHQVAFAYDEGAARLYVDGAEVASQYGSPALYYPSRAVREATGLNFGTLFWGGVSVRARLDEIETFNYPLDAGSIATNYAELADTDGDGMPDAYEAAFGFDRLDAADAREDADGDRIPNVFEWANSGDPTNAAVAPGPLLLVDGSGGGDHTTIGAALAAAAEEEFAIIGIRPGTYVECVSITNSRVMLLGELGSNGPPVISAGPASPDYTLRVGNSSAFDGLVVTKEPGKAGAGIYVAPGAEPLLANLIVRDNLAESGAGVYNDGGSPLLVHCTLHRNAAATNGHGNAIFSAGGSVAALNSILWHGDGGAPEAIYAAGGTVACSNSIVAGGQYGGSGQDPSLTRWGYLTTNSPAIDMGTNAPFATLDINGEPRDSGAAPDAGADEFWDDDGDGLPDWWEALYAGYTDDGDGLSPLDEYRFGTDPGNPDTDGDGLPDGWEATHGLDPTDDGTRDPGNGASGDPDADGIGNPDEMDFDLDPKANDEASSSGRANYLYDAIDRLTGVSGRNASGYTYDAEGNLLQAP